MKDTTPQAVQACHERLLWLIPQLDKFPRSRRFTLGERLESTQFEVLEWFVHKSAGRGVRVSMSSFPGLRGNGKPNSIARDGRARGW